MSKQPLRNKREIKASTEPLPAPAPVAEELTSAPVETPAEAASRAELFEAWKQEEIASIRFKVNFDTPRNKWRITAALGVLSAIEWMKDKPTEPPPKMIEELIARRIVTKGHEEKRAMRKELRAKANEAKNV